MLFLSAIGRRLHDQMLLRTEGGRSRFVEKSCINLFFFINLAPNRRKPILWAIGYRPVPYFYFLGAKYVISDNDNYRPSIRVLPVTISCLDLSEKFCVIASLSEKV